MPNIKLQFRYISKKMEIHRAQLLSGLQLIKRHMQKSIKIKQWFFSFLTSQNSTNCIFSGESIIFFIFLKIFFKFWYRNFYIEFLINIKKHINLFIYRKAIVSFKKIKKIFCIENIGFALYWINHSNWLKNLCLGVFQKLYY